MNSIFLLVAFIVALIYVPIIKWVAIKTNTVDIPNNRKMHQKPKPLLGGVAVFLSIVTVYGFYLKWQIPVQVYQMFTYAFILLVLGIIDDKYDLKAWYKLIGQIIVAVLTTKQLGGISSIEIYGISLYFTHVQGLIIEAVWFIVLINAFNLIDGLDGLATGTGILSFVTMLIIALMNNDMNNVVLFYIIIGSLMGFLFYNFYPSTIFLGDAGAMVIGYFVAILSINNYKTVTVTSLIFLMLIVFLPILDVLLSFVRRKVNGGDAFKADSLHFHHRLMRRGYSHQQTVLIMYGFMLIYVIGAILISITKLVKIKIMIFIGLIIITIIIVEKFYLLSDHYAYFSKAFKAIKRKVK